MDTENYQHELLDTAERHQVGLLTLNADTFSSPLQASIRLTSLDFGNDINEPLRRTEGLQRLSNDYEALSYTWGEEAPKCKISIDGRYFLVTQNLEHALWHLRYAQTPRTLWIDAICLDQTNDQEKRHQIPLMHLIYAQAKRVVVWLGPRSVDSDLGMQYIHDLHGLIEPGRENEVNDHNHISEWPVYPLSLGPFSQEYIDAAFGFYRILARPWWVRAWIFQEIAFARDAILLCGSCCVSWIQILKTGRVRDGLGKGWPARVLNNALGLSTLENEFWENDQRERVRW